MRVIIAVSFLLALMQEGNSTVMRCRILFTLAGASIFICGQNVNAIPKGAVVCVTRNGQPVCPAR